MGCCVLSGKSSCKECTGGLLASLTQLPASSSGFMTELVQSFRQNHYFNFKIFTIGVVNPPCGNFYTRNYACNSYILY